MKQLWAIVLVSLIVFPGCQKRRNVVGPPMQEQGIVATPDGMGVVLTWNPIGECDGYAIQKPYGDRVPLSYTNTFVDSYPAETGIYIIFAVFGGQWIPIDSISSAPYESESDGGVSVWGAHHGPSGFGWNTTTGIGASYDCINEYRDVIDFFLREIEFPLYFFSADEFPYIGKKTTGIQIMGSDDFFSAPESNYNTHARASPELYYAFKLEGNYYAKVYVVAEGCHTTIGFKYEFQTIQGLRIF
jgi:hypothetical protein